MKINLSQDETALLQEASTKGPLGKAAIYARLSGPGWLQGAITLGGGSLAGALYLGILFGPHMLWLQPLAMICGVALPRASASWCGKRRSGSTLSPIVYESPSAR